MTNGNVYSEWSCKWNLLSGRDKDINKGYNLLKAPVKVELSIVYTTRTNDEYYKDENGVKTLVKHEVDRDRHSQKIIALPTEFTQKLSSTNKALPFQQLVVWVQSLSQLLVLPLHSQVF